MTVDAVIFDWGGTLTPWHTFDPLTPWRMCARVIDEVGVDTRTDGDAGVSAGAGAGAGVGADAGAELAGEARIEALAGRLLAIEDAVWKRAREHHESTTMEAVFAAAGIALEEPVVEAYYRAWEPHTFTDPDVPALFTALRQRGIRVGVLSNTYWPRALHERVFARDGVLDLIDGAVYTSEIPWVKPHPAAFEAALAAVGGTDPSRAVYVGDRLYDDIHGATSVGMRAIHLPHSTIPDHQRGHVEGVPDASVDRLSEILSLVDRWRDAV